MSYIHHRGRCAGRVLYFLGEYDYHLGQSAQVGDGSVFSGKEEVFKYKWYEDKFHGTSDIPLFHSFSDEMYECIGARQKSTVMKVLREAWAADVPRVKFPLFELKYIGSLESKKPFSTVRQRYELYCDREKMSITAVTEDGSHTTMGMFTGSDKSSDIENEALIRAWVEVHDIDMKDLS